jgi:hypothetical protein
MQAQAAAAAMPWPTLVADSGTMLLPHVTSCIRLKRIYNFGCSMLVYASFALCFVILRGVFMHFSELTY